MNKKYTTIAIYIVITAVIIMTAGELIINYKNIFGLIGGLWELLWTVFRPATIGFAIAYLLFPVVKKLNGFFMLFEKSINKRNPEVRSHWALSVATTWFLVLAGISAVLTVLVSTVTENVKFVSIIEMSKAAETIVLATEDFYRKALQFLGTLNIAASDVDAVLKNFGETAIGWFQNASNNFAGSVSSVVSSMGTLLFSIIFSIYFMVDGDNILNYWKRVLQILLPEKIYTGIGMVIEDADRCFSGYIRGQIADAIIMAVIFSVVLSIIKVPYAVVIGILSGIGNLIPYIGPVVAYGGVALSCLMSGDIKKLILAVVIVFIIQTIDGNVINPKLLSSSIQVHPLLVISALLIGGSIGGVLGMLLAVPLGALIKLEFDRFVKYRMEK